MPPSHPPHEVNIWADGRSAAMARAVLAAMGDHVALLGVGGVRQNGVAQLASETGCRLDDDLRRLLNDRPAAFLLLASVENVSPEDVRTALEQGCTVLAMVPPAADFDELEALEVPQRGQTQAPPGQIVQVPAFLRCPGWTRAADPVETLGTVRAMGFTSLGMADSGTLFTRLWDAWRVILTLSDLPETIDASLTGLTGEPPDRLRDLAGHLTAHARLTGTGGVTLQLSDRAGDFARRLVASGEHGHLRVADAAYTLYDADGRPLDQARDAAEQTCAELVAMQWRELLDQGRSTLEPPVPDRRRVMACCHATLLSVRTGSPESPRRLLEMQGVR